MEDLDKAQDGKHGEEAEGEILTEYGHGQQRFNDGLTNLVVDALDFSISKTAQEDLQGKQNRFRGVALWQAVKNKQGK